MLVQDRFLVDLANSRYARLLSSLELAIALFEGSSFMLLEKTRGCIALQPL